MSTRNSGLGRPKSEDVRICAALKELLAERGITNLSKLAEDLGMAQGSVYRWVNGAERKPDGSLKYPGQVPSLANIERIEKTLGWLPTTVLYRAGIAKLPMAASDVIRLNPNLDEESAEAVITFMHAAEEHTRNKRSEKLAQFDKETAGDAEIPDAM